VDFFIASYPAALRVANEYYQLEGARFEWVLHSDGTPAYHADQLHNNLIPVLALWSQAALTDDPGLLADNFALMQDAVRFVLRYALRQDATGSWHLRELIPVDESRMKKRDDLLTTVITCRALEILAAAARLIGGQLDADLATAQAPIESILARLAADGVYKPYEDGDVGTWALPLAHLHRPDPTRFTAALERALAGCQETHGLGIGNVSRMRYATFPWGEGIFAWAMARNDHPGTWEQLRMMIRFTNFHGALPEYVWAHGEPSREWFVAAHGVFVAALAAACVQRRGDCVTFFPAGLEGAPRHGLSFSGFRLEGALLASCQFRKGCPLQVELANTTETAIVLSVACPGALALAVTLAPGATWKGMLPTQGAA
jgi:hypothetical protein